MWSGSSDPAGSGYDAGGTRGEGKRRAATIEIKSEDQILNASQRLKVLNLTREGMRNAPQVRAIVQQIRVLVVGLQGGKLTMSTDNADWNQQTQDFFGQCSRSLDFVDGTDLNNCLKLMITALSAEGGDFAIVFDDGVLSGGTGTGKFRFFESDNIANLEPGEFEKRFGTKWTQSQGLIYNDLGRFVGIVLSGKKRGKTVFTADECFTLTRDPDADAADSPWYYAKRKWRLLQGRGISPQTVAIAALLDMYELVASEVQCGKVNSKIFAQVIDSMGVETDGTDGSEDVDSGATDVAEDDPPAEGETPAEETPADDDTATALDVTDFEATTGGKVLNPPTGTKLELLDVKRPSTQMIQFVEWLNGGAAAVHGLARVYSGLKAESSYTAFRGEQTISLPSVEESQKELERGPLDWIGIKRIQWGIDTGRLAPGPAGWRSKMQWSWPSMKEVNEVDAQTAVSAKLKNYMATYQGLLGPNWKNILTQVAAEMKYFKEQGLMHPALQTVSGQVVTAGQSDPAKRGKDTEE
jgi:hypothetical protein